MAAKESVVTHVTKAQYWARHQYCVSMAEVQMTLRDTLRVNPQFVIKPQHRQPYCDHPEDGLCFGAAGDDITDAQLAEVNERLAARVGKKAPVQAAAKPKPEPKQPRAAVDDSKHPTEEPGKPKRGLPAGLQEYLRKKREAKEATA